MKTSIEIKKFIKELPLKAQQELLSELLLEQKLKGEILGLMDKTVGPNLCKR